jgi:cytochrome c-type biogenesis protein
VSSTVLDGNLLLAVPIAVLAGLVSFLSPCVLPLVPGYLGYVTGMSGTDLEQERRGRLVLGVGLFVLGFTAVYVTIGWAAGWAGYALQAHQVLLSRILGAVTIVLGLLFAGVLPDRFSAVPTWRPAAGLAGAPLLGAAFGLGWTACTGPTLAAIVGLAGIGGSPVRGALLASAYCLGLGLPFLLVALAYRRAMDAFGVVRRHRVAVTRAGGGLLVLVGVLLVTGLWTHVITSLQGAVNGFETVI